MKVRTSLWMAAVAAAVACSGGDDAAQTAEDFWMASKAGDIELAKTYVTEASVGSIKEPGESGSSIGDVSLGELSFDGDQAMVETSLIASGDEPMTVEFRTILVQEDGRWKVDLDQTTDELMKSMLGVTMGEMAEAMGNAMGEAMGAMAEGMAQGMADGMKAMGEALADSMRGRKD